MSAFVVMIPAMMSGPALVTAIAVAGAALGLKALSGATQNNSCDCKETGASQVDVPVPNSHALSETMDEGDILPLAGNGFMVTFTKDGRGNCHMRVEGKGKTKAELESLGKNLINKVAQQYAYQKVTQELKKKGFTLVEEKTGEDNSIRITVRKWS